jgi:hypothetical protein
VNDGVTTESKAPPVADLVEVIGEENIEENRRMKVGIF